jgi:uncharacterized membrane protein YhaH (DUF805 family)
MTTTESPAALNEVPLSAPYYGASLPVAFTRFWRKYATFSGRASRSEYWWWALVSIIVAAIFYIIGSVAGGIYGPVSAAGTATLGGGYWIYVTLSLIWGLATVVPNLALIWRRMHDSNRSGGFYFLGLIPFVGAIIVLVFLLLPANPEGARFDR